MYKISEFRIELFSRRRYCVLNHLFAGKDDSSAASDASKKPEANGTAKSTATTTTASNTNGTKSDANGDAKDSQFKKNSDFKQESRKDDKKKEGSNI